MIEATSVSSHPGMGAIPFSGGTAFRVWAPFASGVWVAGTFNNWSTTRHPLSQDGQGYWSADVPEAKVGDQYKFVIVNGDQTLWRIDPYAGDVTNSVGNGVIVDQRFDWGTEVFQMPPWNELVIYEMHIGTFNDRPGGKPGNLKGVIRRLPHLRALGINAIQVMPPFEFPGAFSWGYNPAHIFSLEEDYGGPNGFKELIKAAHLQGIAVLFDVVYNHLGPSDLDLWQFDGWHQHDRGGIYFYNDGRAETPWGHTRPDYGRAEVRQYLRDNALMWLEQYRVDGLRWDATAYIRNAAGRDNDPAHDIPEGWSLMRWIHDEIKARQPWKISIAEDLRNNEWITKRTSDGGAGFDAQWDAGFVHPVREAIIASDDGARNIYAVRDAIVHRYNGDPLQRVIYTESHDEVANGKARVPHEIAPENSANYYAKKRSTVGAALVLTSPGIPMIFQGQELLEDEWFRDVDPIDWTKAERFRGIVTLYRDLIRLRRNWHDTTRGLCGPHVNVYHVNHHDKVLAYHRWDQGGPGDDVLVVVNLGHQAFDAYSIGVPREGIWRVRFNSDWQGYSPDFGNRHSYDLVANRGERDGLAFHGTIGFGAYTAVVFSQDR